LHSNIIAYVPSASVKDILIQPDIDGRRSKWIAKILEFDLEIKPTKLVKGQGLAKLLVESNCKDLGVNFIKLAQKIIKLNCLIQFLKTTLHWQDASGTKTLYFFCKS
jgi:hypothetical protein